MEPWWFFIITSMEEITKLCDRMSLTAKEGGRVDLSDSLEDLGGLLAAKFLTKRVVNLEAVMRTLKPIWQSVQGFTGRDIRSPTSPKFFWVLHFISHEYLSFLKISFENKLHSINTQGCFSFGGLKQLPKLPSGLASPKCLFSVFVYHFCVLGIQQKVGPECVFFFCFRTPFPRLEHSTKS